MKIRIILISFLIASIYSCKTLDKLTQFNMDYDQSIVIPSSTGIDLPFNIQTPDVESNSESTFAVNDTRKDLIEKIQLTDLTLTLTSPSDADFGFLKSISIFISAEGLSETKIAWKEDIPDNPGTVLTLETTGVDLKEYIKKDKFSLRLNTVTDELITSDHHIDMHSVFFVDAQILGL